MCRSAVLRGAGGDFDLANLKRKGASRGTRRRVQFGARRRGACDLPVNSACERLN